MTASAANAASRRPTDAPRRRIHTSIVHIQNGTAASAVGTAIKMALGCAMPYPPGTYGNGQFKKRWAIGEIKSSQPGAVLSRGSKWKICA